METLKRLCGHSHPVILPQLLGDADLRYGYYCYYYTSTAAISNKYTIIRIMVMLVVTIITEIDKMNCELLFSSQKNMKSLEKHAFNVGHIERKKQRKYISHRNKW